MEAQEDSVFRVYQGRKDLEVIPVWRVTKDNKGCLDNRGLSEPLGPLVDQGSVGARGLRGLPV